MANYYVTPDLNIPVIPWLYIDIDDGLFYLMAFSKVSNTVEQSLYENFYNGNIADRSQIYSDIEANTYLTIDNLVGNVFSNSDIYTNIRNPKTFKGSQIGGINSTSLYYLTEAVKYEFDANLSYNADGSKKPQLWRIVANEPGALTVPTEFILDRVTGPGPIQFLFNFSPILHTLVNLNNASFANSLVILHYHSDHGYYCNQNVDTSANAHNTMVNFLPSIALTVTDNTVFSTTNEAPNLEIAITYSNTDPYPTAQTKVIVDSSKGYISNRQVPANSTANAQIIGLNLREDETMTVTAGWSNYVNVATLDLSIVNNYVAPVPAKVEFATPGSYEYTMPNAYSQAIVRVYGGGGGGGKASFPGPGPNGAPGTNSSFNVTVLGRGGSEGKGAEIGEGLPNGDSGTGGAASGGDINIQGFVGDCPGPDGGIGGVLLRDGTPYGAGGSGANGSGGSQIGGTGGSGGYSQKTYTDSELTGNVVIVVGSGGAGGSDAGDGANGGVTIEFTSV